MSQGAPQSQQQGAFLCRQNAFVDRHDDNRKQMPRFFERQFAAISEQPERTTEAVTGKIGMFRDHHLSNAPFFGDDLFGDVFDVRQNRFFVRTLIRRVKQKKKMPEGFVIGNAKRLQF